MLGLQQVASVRESIKYLILGSNLLGRVPEASEFALDTKRTIDERNSIHRLICLEEVKEERV